MVSVLAFYSDDPSLNSAEAYSFSVKFVFEKTKINKKEARVGPFKKMFAKLAPKDRPTYLLKKYDES